MVVLSDISDTEGESEYDDDEVSTSSSEGEEEDAINRGDNKRVLRALGKRLLANLRHAYEDDINEAIHRVGTFLCAQEKNIERALAEKHFTTTGGEEHCIRVGVIIVENCDHISRRGSTKLVKVHELLIQSSQSFFRLGSRGVGT